MAIQHSRLMGDRSVSCFAQSQLIDLPYLLMSSTANKHYYFHLYYTIINNIYSIFGVYLYCTATYRDSIWKLPVLLAPRGRGWGPSPPPLMSRHPRDDVNSLLLANDQNLLKYTGI